MMTRVQFLGLTVGLFPGSFLNIAASETKPPMMHATGSFQVKLAPQTDSQDDPTMGRMTIDKQFGGDLQATSKGQMLSAATNTKGLRVTSPWKK